MKDVSPSEWLERRIIDELCLLHDLHVELCALVVGLLHVAPVQEVVVVDHAAAEVGLKEGTNSKRES